MHWILLIGGDSSWIGGQRCHRACIHHCSSKDLQITIKQCFHAMYSISDCCPTPPLPQFRTYALGFQIDDQSVVKERLVTLMKRRMDQLDVWSVSSADDLFDGALYEDGPEGYDNFDLLSRDKSVAGLQSVAEHLLDSGQCNEQKIDLYEFSDRPEGFAVPQLPEVREIMQYRSGQNE